MKGLTWRVVTVWLTVLFAIYLLVPSVIFFSTGNAIPKKAKPGDPWYYSVLPSQMLKLGLDLSGGTHLVLGIDQNDARLNALTSLKRGLTESAKYDKIDGFSAEVTNDDKIALKYPAKSREAVDNLIKRYSTQVEFLEQGPEAAKLRLTATHEDSSQDEAVNLALEGIRRRIDEFGVAEPIITKQGTDKIMVQFPGEQNPERLKDIISRTAKLTFQIAKGGKDIHEPVVQYSELTKLVEEFKKEKKVGDDPKKPISLYARDLNAWLGSKVPAGTEIVFERKINVNTKEAEFFPYLLEKEPIVGGDQLSDAHYGHDEKNQPIVYFSLNPGPLGADRFAEGTGANVGKQMAIVLDNFVSSAPTIQNRIGGGNGSISFGAGNYETKLQEARDTSLILRSGALPAKLEFLEERIVGPSLGLDAIKQGSYSLIAGLIGVFIFMMIYYRASGGVAVLALTLNGLFVFAVLAAFEGTLTLPGLAGITLTLGMAVDANVLIFEHMREELRLGRSVTTAIAEGYSRAFSAILDGNLTTIIAGFVLLQFGYGPIRGFAVTLLIGLTASMYTAVFVTRVIYDSFIVAKGKKTISL